MKDILSEIIANKRFEIDFQQRSVPTEQLQDAAQGCTSPTRSMKQALQESSTGIIAEFKRRSPSKGWIHETAAPETLIPAYEEAGASAISILTDEKFFGGNLRDIRMARPLTRIPILRKDFIVDVYQLYQARIVGADAVLLIAAALSPEQCHKLTEQAHELGMEVLLEIHSPDELDRITPQTDMIGVNNRHLGTFFTDVNTSFYLSGLLPEDITRVSESGISEASTVKRLRQMGFRGFLIGETFMKTEEPADTLRRFINSIEREET